jgi:hypothetical protein
MLVARWRRIESLFHEALEKTPKERAGFLDQACSSDQALRGEIESLLSTRTWHAVFSSRTDPAPTRSKDATSTASDCLYRKCTRHLKSLETR